MVHLLAILGLGLICGLWGVLQLTNDEAPAGGWRNATSSAGLAYSSPKMSSRFPIRMRSRPESSYQTSSVKPFIRRTRLSLRRMGREFLK